MKNNNNLFQEAHDILKSNIEAHVRNWLPDGKKEDHSYVALNPTRDDKTLGSFRVKLNSGLWKDFATGDGGDIIKLYAYLNGLSDYEAALKITGDCYKNFQFCSSSPSTASKPSKTGKSHSSKLADKLWQECACSKGTVVETYLKNRGYEGDIPETIKFHPNLYDNHSKQYYPGLVGKLQGYNSEEIFAIQRIYLTSQGEKANIHAPKKFLGKPTGSSVHIGELKAGRRLALAEGIETALSFSQMYKIPTWACLSKNNLKNALVPPQEIVSEIIIAGDNDTPGLEVAHAKATELKKSGYKIKVVAPSISGDFNDLLISKLKPMKNIKIEKIV
jgi:hypothetical protein